MKKKLSLALALVFIFTSGLAFANVNGKISYLQDKNIVAGRILADGKIDLALDQPITRAEFAKITTMGIKLSEEIPDFTFIDTMDHWAKVYIDQLSNDPRGILQGYEDGTFKPDNNITNAELAAMLVKACKKDLSKEDRLNALWPDSYIVWANELNLFQGLDIKDVKDKASRQTAFEMLYNAMAVLALEENSESKEFSEFDPASRDQSFEWIYNAMDKLGKVDHSKDVKDRIKDVFGSASIKKGEAVDITLDITGKKDGDSLFAEAKISAPKSLLKPGSMALNDDFSEISLTYSSETTSKLAGSYFQASYRGQNLPTSFDPQTGKLVVKLNGLVDVLSAGENYPVKISFVAGDDIQ